MRLLIATPLYPPEPGGPATYVKLLEEHLPLSIQVLKFRDVRTYPKIFRHLCFFWRVYQEAKHADLVLALDPVSVGLPSVLAARLRKKPFVVKVVGDYAWEQGTQRFGVKSSLDDFVRTNDVPILVRVLRAVQVYTTSRASAVIVPSEYLKSIVCAWGIPPESVHVIYNAVKLEREGEVPDMVKALPKPLIVTAGRLVPWKHVSGVIDAVAKSSASLCIVGDGPERSQLEAHAAHTLSGRTAFTGALSHADTLAAIKQADVFVLNSSYEGLSHVLIEALMLGKTIIATDIGGNPELITDQHNGMLIPSGDTSRLAEAIMRVLADPKLATELGAHARVSSERFTLSHMIEQTSELLKKLVHTI